MTWSADKPRLLHWWLVWGGRRTGSTVCFNILRELLDREGYDVATGYITESYTGKSRLAHVVTKTHEEVFRSSVRAKFHGRYAHVIFPVRDPRGQLASLQRVFPADSKRWRKELDITILICVSALIIRLTGRVSMHAIQNDWSASRKVEAISRALPWRVTCDLGALADVYRIDAVRSRLQEQFGNGHDFESNWDAKSHWHAGHINESDSAASEPSMRGFRIRLVVISWLNQLITNKDLGRT